MLEVEDLTKRFGGVAATSGCSLQVRRGTITALIGPNGSGKTTLFNVVTGLIRPDSGRIVLDGRRIEDLPPHRIARSGLARTFQISRLFPSLTVLENMVVSSFTGTDATAVQRARSLLDYVHLGDKADDLAREISYGQRKLLEFARSLMNDPKIVLLDEPFAGVNPVLEERLIERIEELNHEGVTFFIVDHEMQTIMSLCNPIIVLDHGEVIAEGPGEDIRSNPEVVDAYFGKPPAAVEAEVEEA